MPLPPPWSDRLQAALRERERLDRDRRIAPPSGLDFTSNDYLGLRRDPRLAEAAAQAAQDHGSGSGAARLLRGSCPLHEELEAELAAWKGQEASLLFNTGFQCNATLIPALLQAGDAVFSDALNHASLVDGCRMARTQGVRVEVFRHLDLGDLAFRLKAWRNQAAANALALVVTDAVFSMDGDAADLPGLCTICERECALLMVDEAHATGLLGDTGAGLAEAQGVKGRVGLLMGTLGKALGAFGAYVACSAALREHLVNRCRGFIFSTALPPPVLGSALASLRIARSELWRRDRALGFADRLRTALELPPQPSAIVPVLLGPDRRAVAAARALQAQGFDVRAVRPPTVPEGEARLRLTTGAHLEAGEVEALVTALQRQQALDWAF